MSTKNKEALQLSHPNTTLPSKSKSFKLTVPDLDFPTNRSLSIHQAAALNET